MKPKILYIDIETAPSEGLYFDMWKENNIVATTKPWYVLSVAWRWEGGKTEVAALPDYSHYKKSKTDDWYLMRTIHQLLDEADIVIAHNGDNFDLKKLNARFLILGLTPPSPYKTIDTLKVARKYFKLDSNRLEAIALVLGIGSKVPHTGIKLWQACMAGDLPSWKDMKKYNVHDVDLLVDVYKELRPWIKNHPNLTWWSGNNGACANCGKNARIKRGFGRNKKGLVQKYQCKACGAWS